MSKDEQLEKQLIEFELFIDNLSPATRKDYGFVLQEFRRFLEGKGRSYAKPTVFDVAEYLKWKKTTCKPTTLGRNFAAVRKYFLFLKKKKIISNDDYDFLLEMRPKPTKGDEAHRALSREEIQQCFARISHPLFRFIFWLGVNFGLRREEYTKLKVTDVDLKRKRLRIHGKGDKVRFIPITRSQLLRFERFLQQRERDLIQHEYLIYSKWGNIVGKTISVYFQSMKEMSGVDFTSHDLRVTFATIHWKAGQDIYVISKILGHSNIQTTISYIKPTKRETDERYLQIAEDLSYS